MQQIEQEVSYECQNHIMLVRLFMRIAVAAATYDTVQTTLGRACVQAKYSAEPQALQSRTIVCFRLCAWLTCCQSLQSDHQVTSALAHAQKLAHKDTVVRL